MLQEVPSRGGCNWRGFCICLSRRGAFRFALPVPLHLESGFKSAHQQSILLLLRYLAPGSHSHYLQLLCRGC